MTSTVALSNLSTFAVQAFRSGASDESMKLQQIHADMFATLRRSVTWDVRGNLMAALIHVCQECNEDNWDGYGSRPISPTALFEAKRFIEAMPNWLPNPDIVPEPSGDIGFEWHFGKNRVFVASISGTNRITYAGLLGPGNNIHGTEAFDGSIPQTIVFQIKRICADTLT